MTFRLRCLVTFVAIGLVSFTACGSSIYDDAAVTTTVRPTTTLATLPPLPPLPPLEEGLPPDVIDAGVDLIKGRHPTSPEPVLRELVIAILNACDAEFFGGEIDPTAPDLSGIVTGAPAEFGGPETVADDVADLCRP